MSSAAELAVLYNIANAPVRTFPYPHIYVREVFPPEYYRQIQRALPASELLKPILEARSLRGYPERFVLNMTPEEIAQLPAGQRELWNGLTGWLLGQRFAHAMLRKFGSFIEERLGTPNFEARSEALLVEDRTRYSLGPHTDTPRKVLALLFYLPADESQAHLGTSIYLPKDPQFTCPGGPHHSFDLFERVTGMPFLPNSLFAFVKTSNSFHGVEPVTDADTRRHLLLYDIHLKELPAPAQSPSGARFTF